MVDAQESNPIAHTKIIVYTNKKTYKGAIFAFAKFFICTTEDLSKLSRFKLKSSDYPFYVFGLILGFYALIASLTNLTNQSHHITYQGHIVFGEHIV